MDFYGLAIIGLIVGMNIFYAILTNNKEKRNLRRENLFIKAIIAKNVAEFAGAEETPEDRVTILEKENELAVNAQKLVPPEPEMRIPVG